MKRAFIFLVAVAIPIGASAAPSFDCSKATEKVEKTVCADAGLSALDRRSAELYGQAARQTDDRASLLAGQRGWLRDRNACGSTDCVTKSYQTRIAELQIQNGLVTAPAAVEYACNDNSKPFTAAFYDIEPRAAVLTWGDGQVVALAVPSGSGARYAGRGVDFWEHHGEATVHFEGHELTCRATPTTAVAAPPPPMPNGPVPATAPPDTGAESFDYSCGGKALTATFDTPETVIVMIDGATYNLEKKPSGSGAKYADNKGRGFWSKGETEAIWTQRGQDVRCTAMPRD